MLKRKILKFCGYFRGGEGDPDRSLATPGNEGTHKSWTHLESNPGGACCAAGVSNLKLSPGLAKHPRVCVGGGESVQVQTVHPLAEELPEMVVHCPQEQGPGQLLSNVDQEHRRDVVQPCRGENVRACAFQK